MSDIDDSRAVSEYNALWKEQNDIYDTAVRSYGMSDSVLWILYFLRINGGMCSQKSLCELMHRPKQTTNSAIKQMERKGLILLSDGSNRRSKAVSLTEAGALLAAKSADRLIAAERLAMGDFSREEQRQFIYLLEKYNKNLKGELG